MSRTQPAEKATRIEDRTYTWRGSTGRWRYYDRDKDQAYDLDPATTPLVVLDMGRSMITGFNEPSNSCIWSNEVASPNAKLKVRCKDATLHEGTYKDIKAALPATGGQWTMVLYCLGDVGDGKNGIIRVLLSGSGLGNIFELRDSVNLEGDVALIVKDTEKGKKGSVEFIKPVFSTTPIIQEMSEEAAEADRALQQALNASKSSANSEEAVTQAPKSAPDGAEADDLRF